MGKTERILWTKPKRYITLLVYDDDSIEGEGDRIELKKLDDYYRIGWRHVRCETFDKSDKVALPARQVKMVVLEKDESEEDAIAFRKRVK